MTSVLALLPYAACPLGMGLGVWLLMRMNRRHAVLRGQPKVTMAVDRQVVGGTPDDPAVRLRAQLRELGHRQAAVLDEIERRRDQEQNADATRSNVGGRT